MRSLMHFNSKKAQQLEILNFDQYCCDTRVNDILDKMKELQEP